MNIFHCDHCDHLVFFENTHCVACGHLLAFLPDLMEVGSLEPAGNDCWSSPLPAASGHSYRLCQNYIQHNVCNWAIVADDPNPLCESCRLTTMIPDLSRPGTLDAWFRLELAKRRVVYTLKTLALPFTAGSGPMPHPDGLQFRFLADDPSSPAPVLTGHQQGTVTVNIAEADDAERERRRQSLGEPYRTLLGHLRHEIGHFYWNVLVDTPEAIGRYRELFGDEREDYDSALQRYYQSGARPDWNHHFVSAYASAHPWEDWAETWAHYLHIIDTLQMSESCGVSVHPGRPGEPALPRWPQDLGARRASFDGIIEEWFTLTYVLNNLNRGMGLPDAYPFVLAPPAVEKLRFVHETVARVAAGRPF